MPNIDWTTFLPIITGLLPFVMGFFPGLRNIFMLLPDSFYEYLVKLKGGTVTWTKVSSREYKLLEAETFAAIGTPQYDELKLKLMSTNEPKGGILDIIKNNPTIIIIIVVGIMFFVMRGKQPQPAPTPPAKTLIEAVR